MEKCCDCLNFGRNLPIVKELGYNSQTVERQGKNHDNG
jgi:hypothetical protein